MTDIRNPGDAATDRLLRGALEATRAAEPTADCLDAETLAAWTDDGLTGQARELAEAHVAGCARCQAVLAAMVRADPGVAPAPERTRRWWALGWIVPVVAAAAAVVVWFAVPRRETQPPAPAPSSAAATIAAAPAPIAVAQLPPPASTMAAARRAPEPTGQTRAKAPATVDQLSAKDVAPAPVPPPKAKPEAAAPMRANEAVRVAPPAAAAGSAMGALEKSSGTAERPSPLVEFATPDRRVRWRIGGSTVARSTDSGATWSPVATGLDAKWMAGSAPAEATCWLVGRNGAVAVTADGRTWRRLTAPDQTDLTAVQASDEKTATVTTSDGRRFRTTDGGASWVGLQGIPAAPFYE